MKRGNARWAARAVLGGSAMALGLVVGAEGEAHAALVPDGRIDVAVLNQTSRDASFWQEANLATTLRTAPGTTPFRLAYVASSDLSAAGLAAYDALVIPTDQRAFLTEVPGAQAAIAVWVQGGGVLILAPGDMPKSIPSDPLVAGFGAGYTLGWSTVVNDMSDYYCFDGVPRASVKTLRPLSATEPLVHLPNEVGAVFTACDRASISGFGSKFRVVATTNSFTRGTATSTPYVKYEMVAAPFGLGSIVASPASYVLNTLQHQQLAENLFRTAKIPADVTPPTLSLGATPVLTGDPRLGIRGTAVDIGGLGYVRFRLNGTTTSAPTPDASGAVTDTITLVEGTNVITLVAGDLSGNTATVGATVILDTTAPLVALGTGSVLTNQPSYALTGTVTDTGTGLASVRVLRNGEVVATATPAADGSFTAAIRLVEGLDTLVVEATDLVGNVSSAVREVRLDTAPPVVGLGALPAFTSHTVIDVAGSAHDDFGVASATVTVNGVLLGDATIADDGTFVVPAAALIEGTNTVVLQVTDRAGNTAAAQLEVDRDTAPPVVTFVTPGAGQAFGSSSVPVTVSVDDRTPTTVLLDGTESALDGGGGRVSAVISIPAEGMNTIIVTATDAAGNVTTASLPVLLDFTAPVVSTPLADGARLGPLDGDLLPVTLHVDDLSATTVSIGSDAQTLARGGGVVQSAVPLHEGQNTLTATITDETGQVTTVSRTVIYDVTPPSGAFATPASGVTIRVSADLTLTARDALTDVSAVVVQIDGGEAIALSHADGDRWAASIDTTTLADGAHTATAVLTDGVGNSATVETTFTVDNTGPTLAITGPSADAIVGGTISITATAQDALSGVDFIAIAVNGVAIGRCAAATSCTLSTSTANLPDGPFLITATAMDAAGNEAIPAQIKVIADNSAPAKFLLSPLPGAIITGPTQVTVAIADEHFASVACDLTAATATTATALDMPQNPASSAALDSSTLLDGPASLRCVATDLAGNTGIETTTFAVKNWYDQMVPRVLDLKVKQPSSTVDFWVSGVSVGKLWPTAPLGLTMTVPCGAPLSLLPETAAPTPIAGHPGSTLVMKFSRAGLIASLRAGIASGCIDKTRPVPVQIVSRGQAIAVDPITLVGF